MSKVPTDFGLTKSWKADAVENIFRLIVQQLNELSSGRINAKYLARTSAPVNGAWKQGDEVYNSTPTELGSAGGMYVIDGWVCVASGEPGTWKEKRVLTGN